MNSASLCSLAGRYENPIPPRWLAPIHFLKIPAQFAGIPRRSIIVWFLSLLAKASQTVPCLRSAVHDHSLGLYDVENLQVNERFLIGLSGGTRGDILSVPEIIDPVFAKTSQNACFLLSENERFGFRENWVYKFGHSAGHKFVTRYQLL